MYRGSDPEGSRVTYFISGDYFSVDSNTGVVSHGRTEEIKEGRKAGREGRREEGIKELRIG